MNEVYTEKEILGDALNSEKNATTLYNLGANECVHVNLRMTTRLMFLIRCIQWATILHLPLKQKKCRRQKQNLNVDLRLCKYTN